MKAEELKNFLQEKNVSCKEQQINYGVQLRCPEGEIFTVYDSGKVVIGGKRTPLSDLVEQLTTGYIGQHGKAAFACVLLTADDEGFKVGETDKKQYRARQNDVLELGMVLARLGRRRVAILRKKTVEQPSDIHGLIYISFDEHVEEIKTRIFQELQAAGFNPKL